ncbi:MAG: tetratricopeptide repeat protein, partial [Acidobacteriota bacterium]|nr:tetratricopeptide repeat protein [Acidobacteriota bacterium]
MILLFFALSISAQTLTETNQKIRNAVENRDYQTAVSELENLEKSDKKVFALNNYDYLLARTAEKRGDFAAAMGNYQAVVNRNSVLSEYAWWHLSQIARSAGNLLLERIYLQKILMLAPESLLTDAVNTRMARSYFESKNFDVTIQLLSSQPQPSDKGQRTKDDGRTRENLVLLGNAYLQIGKLNEAREVFTRLTNNLSNPAQPDDFALSGAKSLDELDGGLERFGKTAPQLPATEHQRRAAIYQFNRNFPLARLHYQAIVERYPTYSFASHALYQIGRGFAQEGNYAQAINWFERLQAQFPDDEVARDALSQTASAYVRVNQPTEAILRYQKFIEKYPNADNLERAYLNIVDIFRDIGNDAEALSWTAKTQTAFKGKLPEAIALFAQTRIHIAQNDWKNALSDLNTLLTLPDLGGTRVPGGTNKAELIFLKGFALENSNRYAEAIDTYLLIPDGRGEYYGWRATERLKALATDEKARPFITNKLGELTANIESRNAEAQRKAAQSAVRLTDAAEIQTKMLAIIRKSYPQLPEYQKIPNAKLLEVGRKEILKESRKISTENHHKTLADELLFLGLYDEATPELEKSRQSAVSSSQTQTEGQRTKDDGLNYTLAVFYKRGDMAHRAVAYIEPLWRNVPADYQLELIPREQIELLYPTPYTDALVQFAPPRNV